MNEHAGKACIVDVNIGLMMEYLGLGPMLRAMLHVGETSEGQPVVVEILDDHGVNSIRIMHWPDALSFDRWLLHHAGWIVIPAPVVNAVEISRTGQNHHR
jgi:hypothetical protein